MRALTKKQKSLLKKWFEESKHKEPWDCFYTYDITSVDDLTVEQFEKLQEINDTEILYQEVDRYLDDLHSKTY
jgi:hypothetical protein